MRLLAVVFVLMLSACATTPVVDKAQLARDVFALSGGVDDARLAVRFLAPAAADLKPSDARKACLQAFGRNPGELGRAICDAAAAALGAGRAGQEAASDVLERRLDGIEIAGGRVMEETYTVDELVAMKRFYSSSEGRSIAKKRMDYWMRLVPVILSGG